MIIEWRSTKLQDNPEVADMIRDLTEDDVLIMTNCRYMTVQGKFGNYRKRVDYEVNLKDVKRIILYDRYIIFVVDNTDNDSVIRVNITNQFFYQLD